VRAPPPVKAYLLLGVGIFTFSWAAILIKLCDAPSLAIATYRMGIASIILAPAALGPRRQVLISMGKGDLLLSLAAGALLGLHFALWITSLKYTSVASSVILVTLNPIFVALFSHFLIREKLGLKMTVCLITAVSGALLIGAGDWVNEAGSLYGNTLALLGSLMISGNLIIGRKVRQSLDLLPYIFITYTTAALVLLAMGLARGTTFFPFSVFTYLMFLLLALGPTLVGHTSVNWALKYLPAAVLALVILGEPVGATTIAYFLLNEVPTIWRLIGGGLILTGIYFSLTEVGRTFDKA
jgi:drug/metabolite transporter (DMT)-like permease